MAFEIHICWRELREDKIHTPIHTAHIRCGEATTSIFMVAGANAVNSFVVLSRVCGNMVVPRNDTTFACKSFRLRMPTTRFVMLWREVSWTP